MKLLRLCVSVVAIAALTAGCATKEEKQMQAFIDRHVSVIDPLRAEANRTMYTAEITGAKEHFNKLKELRLAINDIYTSSDDFEFLKRMKDSGNVGDHRLARQMDKLYFAYQNSQMDTQLLKDIIELSTSITEKYNNYRGHIDGKETTMTDIYRIMTTSKDSEEHKKAWLASKEVGNAVIDDYLRLVKMRNKAVARIGYSKYHTYSLETGEQSVAEVDKIFEELDELRAAPFAKMKAR
ncbi:MAG: M2 family metallopeptidase, partial [Phycisphaerae bacterium]|nr:M2 family metallopeptidase [Phycisphaerae bacterium]